MFYFLVFFKSNYTNSVSKWDKCNCCKFRYVRYVREMMWDSLCNKQPLHSKHMIQKKAQHLVNARCAAARHKPYECLSSMSHL